MELENYDLNSHNEIFVCNHMSNNWEWLRSDQILREFIITDIFTSSFLWSNPSKPSSMCIICCCAKQIYIFVFEVVKVIFRQCQIAYRDCKDLETIWLEVYDVKHNSKT